MKILYTIIFLLCSIAVTAQTSDCNQPESQNELNINNVRAVVSNGLIHFEDSGSPGYQVPKLDPGVDGPNSIYSDGLWIRGFDSDGQLHLAATTYPSGQGSEFSSGPLQNNGTPEQDQAMCGQYDNVYRAERADVILHHEYYTRVLAVQGGADSSILTDPPFEDGYMTPAYFYSWPAMNVAIDYAPYLAPFFDFDLDGVYNPDFGDYPGFDLSDEIDCQGLLIGPGPLLGHQATWYVSNDMRLHISSGGAPLGLEIQVMNYAYSTDDALNDATFVQYTIINRTQNIYSDCVISKWVDIDIGCATDDYVGTEVSRGLVYGYNSSATDPDCAGPLGYGDQLAALGVKLLAGPLQDSDGMDNPLIADVAIADDGQGIVYAGQGRGYGDGIVDNERLGTRSSVVYMRNDQTATPSFNGEPNIPIEFASYMQSTWKNGMPITYGGNGVGGSTPTDYMYPGTSDPLGAGTGGTVVDGNWSEGSEALLGGDRRLLLNTSPFTIEPAEVNVLTYAYIWAQDETGESDAQADLFAASDLIDLYYEDCFSEVLDNTTGLFEFIAETQISISPNPATDEVTVRFISTGATVESVRIFDLSGNQVKAESLVESELLKIDLRGLATGFYLIQVTAQDGSQVSSPLVKR